MPAFHGDQGLKDFVLAQLALHRSADKLVKGDYWRDGKGCAVGCTLEAVRLRRRESRIKHDRHALYEGELGIPQILAQLEDRIFENLPNERSQAWPERFITAIRPGADLTLVWARFALWLFTEELPPYAQKRPECVAALDQVAFLYRDWVDSGKRPNRARCTATRTMARRARDAADYPATAYAGVEAAAAPAAYAANAAAAARAAAAANAAGAAAAAASYAAAAAGAAAAWSETRGQAFMRQADQLLKLLADAPMAQLAA